MNATSAICRRAAPLPSVLIRALLPVVGRAPPTSSLPQGSWAELTLRAHPAILPPARRRDWGDALGVAGFEQVAQDQRQDAAVAVIVDLDRAVDARDDHEAQLLAG